MQIPISDGSGELTRFANFASQHVIPRHVDIWCPPGYAATPETRYPVIYMHDGQNLFDPALANTGVDWGVDEAIVRIMRRTGLPGAIVVGSWCTELRRREYMPQRPLSGPAGAGLLADFVQTQAGAPLADQYLRFLVGELKPFVDARFRTLPGQPSTTIMGSSMGGLISLYALAEYPDMFGGAGCLSTHWPIGGTALVDALGAAIPRAGRHRLYFDYGTAGLDAAYEPFQKRMDALVRTAGYHDGIDWRTLKFEGAEHNEAAWRARVEQPLALLLGAP